MLTNRQAEKLTARVHVSADAILEDIPALERLVKQCAREEFGEMHGISPDAVTCTLGHWTLDSDLMIVHAVCEVSTHAD